MWQQDADGRVHHPFEQAILVATLTMIPVLIIEHDATSEAWRAVATAANWLIWGIFAAELALVLAVAQRRRAALRAHWLDAAIVVVTIPLFGRLLASLRLVRLARLLRLLRLATILGRALKAERRLTSASIFRFVGIVTVFLVVVAGAAEATFDQGDFKNTWDGIWWAVVTVTTVGYGDLYPKSTGGRLIGMALMLIGIGFISVLTATVASLFVKTDSDDDTKVILDTLRRIESDLAELKARAD
jgi:voltage-gated potassium channel